MKYTGLALASLAVLGLSVGPAFAQASNDGKPEAPPPAKAAPLETGAKPATTKGAGGGGMKKSGGMKKMKKKHRHM